MPDRKTTLITVRSRLTRSMVVRFTPMRSARIMQKCGYLTRCATCGCSRGPGLAAGGAPGSLNRRKLYLAMGQQARGTAARRVCPEIGRPCVDDDAVAPPPDLMFAA